jgi:structure-specific endonuclease subunit SLX1
MNSLKRVKKSGLHLFMSNEYFVYLLECTDKSTYVGATVNLENRLRQHNCEIKGGAHATRIKVKQGKQWKRICYISGFPDWQAALQFEWAFKFYSRKYFDKKTSPLERRMRGLKYVLNMKKPTTNAKAYSEWPVKPEINWENEDIKNIYEIL